jgi:plasmid maintenance system antidote protein VapI
MTKQDLKQFLEERPSLSKRGLAREADISYQLIDYIIAEKRTLTDQTIEKLEPVMQKYGGSNYT